MFGENWDEPEPAITNPPPALNIKNDTSYKNNDSTTSFRSFNSNEKNWRNKRSTGVLKDELSGMNFVNHKYIPEISVFIGDNFRERRGNKFTENYRNITSIKVDSKKVPKIIGRQGSTIKELERKTGTKIKIGDYCQENSYLREVTITGPQNGREECKEMIEQLAADRIVECTNQIIEDSVPVIDWDTVNALADKAEAERWEKCPPLKKDFYFEDPVIAKMTQEEVEEFRINNNNIVVKNVYGENKEIPNPVATFAQAFKHYPDILKEIEKQGFDKPSPVQCQAWPILLTGRDLIGIAQTGTGKTLAFLLPALIHIDGQEVPRSQRGGANVLIIAPTRELALQIEKEVQKYPYKNIKSVCVYGGANRREQMKTVIDGVEIIIATPGRLNDLVEAKVIDVSSITYLVLDEADRMLDLGFEPQIRKVLLDIRPDRQNVMTSATWSGKVQTLAERYMHDPVQLYIGSLDLAAVHSVSQTVLVVDEDEKRDYLLDFIYNLTKEDKVIVFVSKKVVADQLSCDLSLNHILCQSIHGDREQADREQAIDDLKTGFVRILIATDVASRGLDINDITNIEEYVHRVGRTGRAGKKGESITLFTRKDWAFAGELITIMEEANQPVPQELYDMKTRFTHMLERKQQETHTGGGFRGGRREKRFGGFSWA